MRSQGEVALKRYRDRVLYESDASSSLFDESMMGYSLETITDGSEASESRYTSGSISYYTEANNEDEAESSCASSFSEDMPVVISVLSNRDDEDEKQSRAEQSTRMIRRTRLPPKRAPVMVEPEQDKPRRRGMEEDKPKRRGMRILPIRRNKSGGSKPNRIMGRREKKVERKPDAKDEVVEQILAKRPEPRDSRQNNRFMRPTKSSVSPMTLKSDGEYSYLTRSTKSSYTAASAYPFIASHGNSTYTGKRNQLSQERNSATENTLESRNRIVLQQHKKKKKKRDDSSSIATDFSSVDIEHSNSLEVVWDGKLPTDSQPSSQSRFQKFRHGISPRSFGSRGGGNRSSDNRSVGSRTRSSAAAVASSNRTETSRTTRHRSDDRSATSRRSGVSRFSTGAGSMISSASRRSVTSFKSLGSKIGKGLSKIGRNKRKTDESSVEEGEEEGRKLWRGRKNKTTVAEKKQLEASPVGFDLFISHVTDTCYMCHCIVTGEVEESEQEKKKRFRFR